MGDVAQLERALADARDQAARLRDAAVQAEGDKAASLSGQAADAAVRVRELERALVQAREDQRERAELQEAIERERAVREAQQTIDKDVVKLQKAWDKWQDKFIDMDRRVADLWAEQEALYQESCRLTSVARRAGLRPPFSFSIRPDVQALRDVSMDYARLVWHART